MPRMHRILTTLFVAASSLHFSTSASAQENGSSLQLPDVALPQAQTQAAPTGSTTAAQQTINFPNPDNIEALALLKENGAQLIPITQSHGMYVWAAIMQGKFQMIYTTPDNSAALVGIMFGKDAKLETAEHMDILREMGIDLGSIQAATPPSAGQLAQQNTASAQAPSVTPSVAPTQQAAAPAAQQNPAEQLVAELAKAKSISAGNRIAPSIDILVDPACPYCKAYWRDLKPYVEKGLIHVNLIPVGLISGSSAEDAARILSDAKPLQSWNDHVTNAQNTAGKVILPEVMGQVQQNTSLIQRWSIPAVPYSVYRNRLGKIMVVTGQPQDMNNIINDLLGQ